MAARRRIAEQFPEGEFGGNGGPVPSAALLQDTVDQFEKVIDLERNLLRKSIRKLEHDLEETETEVGMKEEELMVWEEKLQQIQQDNEVKLRLAKVRTDGTRWRHKSESRHAASVRRASPLGGIAEGNEDSSEAEEEEEDEEAGEVSPRGASASGPGAAERGGAHQHTSTVDSINNLAGMVVAELSILRAQWQELVEANKALSHTSQSQPAERGAARQPEGAVNQWPPADPRAQVATAQGGMTTGPAGSLGPRPAGPAAYGKVGSGAGIAWHNQMHQGGLGRNLNQAAQQQQQQPQVVMGGGQLGARNPLAWQSSRAGVKPMATPPTWAQLQRVQARS
mmetsp:Transcript_126749/g.253382  ORF Transcript_126749/g.253382 Transcript_126749/m.253382 type:complete len:338 (-) Transcript_126749:71-1084(-)